MRNDRNKKVKNEDGIAFALRPSDPEAKYAGEEPRFDKISDKDNRNTLLARAFVWYNSFYGKKDAKEMIATYIEHLENIELSKKLRKVPENDFIMTYGWLSRMALRGLKLTENEREMINIEINRLVTRQPINHEINDNVSFKPNVQDIMRERTREVGGELEGIFDQFIIDGAKNIGNIKVIDELTKKNVLPQHMNILVETWKRKQSEFEEVIIGSDKDLVHAYSKFTKTQLKNCVKFCEQVLSDFNSYISIKKASKAPRIRKPVPVEKIVKGVKYLKTFKDGKLELNSLSPVKLHGCSEAYIYDTELRKLIYIVADEYVKTLSVKGTTIVGFDTVKSQVKTIRKPVEMLLEFMKLGKPAGRKYFDEIKTVGVTPKGRINERMVILKAW